MSLDKFDYVLALAEERNLTRAARKAFISQPALTNYINKLEGQLGVKLFDRTVTPIQVTRAGSVYIERMKKIQMEENSLLNELRAMGSLETVFHLGIGSTRGSHWLPRLIPAFCQRHPNVVLQLHEQGEVFLEDGVRRGEIDLVFGALNTSYPDLVYERLTEESVLLAVPRSFPCVGDVPPGAGTIQHPLHIQAERINGIPFLLPYPGNGFYRCAQLLLSQAQVTPGRILNYGNMNTAYQLAARGVGALFITPAPFDRFLPHFLPELVFCTLQEPVYTRTAVAAYQAKNPRLDLVQDMIRLTQEVLIPELESLLPGVE